MGAQRCRRRLESTIPCSSQRMRELVAMMQGLPELQLYQLFAGAALELLRCGFAAGPDDADGHPTILLPRPLLSAIVAATAADRARIGQRLDRQPAANQLPRTEPAGTVPYIIAPEARPAAALAPSADVRLAALAARSGPAGNDHSNAGRSHVDARDSSQRPASGAGAAALVGRSAGPLSGAPALLVHAASGLPGLGSASGASRAGGAAALRGASDPPSCLQLVQPPWLAPPPFLEQRELTQLQQQHLSSLATTKQQQMPMPAALLLP